MPSAKTEGWGCANPECKGKPLNTLDTGTCRHCGCRAKTNFMNIRAEDATDKGEDKDAGKKKDEKKDDAKQGK